MKSTLIFSLLKQIAVAQDGEDGLPASLFEDTVSDSPQVLNIQSNNLFGASVTSAYDDSHSIGKAEENGVGGVQWSVTSNDLTVTVDPELDSYIDVINSLQDGAANETDYTYQICVSRSAANTGTFQNNCGQSTGAWSSARTVGTNINVTLSSGTMTIECDPDSGATNTNNYNISVDWPYDTITYGDKTLSHTANDSDDVSRGSETTSSGYYSLDRTQSTYGAALQDDPTDACGYKLIRDNDITVKIRFLDTGNAVIPFSTISFTTVGASDTILSTGFDTRSPRNMTESMNALVELDSPAETVQLDRNDNTIVGDENDEQQNAGITVGTFTVECNGVITKLSSGVILPRRQLGAFEMDVSGCQIHENAHPVEVHWNAMTTSWSNGDFVYNDCHGDLSTTPLLPSAAEASANSGNCQSVLDLFAYGSFSNGDSIGDSANKLHITFGEDGESSTVPTINNCVASKTGGNSSANCGTGRNTGIDDENTSVDDVASWAPARYLHDDNEDGFQLQFYLVASDSSVTSIDMDMQLALDAQFVNQDA